MAGIWNKYLVMGAAKGGVGDGEGETREGRISLDGWGSHHELMLAFFHFYLK